MELFFIVFGVLALLMLVMAVGVIFANKPITGSCGGMSALGMEVACDVCGGDKDKCDKEVDSSAKDATGKDISYNAMK
ncbi:ApbE family protein [Oleiphilus sp. HI0081]|uniref:(Na+)-NQR maturation NqrM n=1 Tax=unclassified Oleiphilus TaxID=2631174 RepID=UPI0007C339F3|nr:MULTISPECIES: (Na+)-NQR maturation NqrM [unclassified Oleiphilus]KZY90908.1 ApbE family protein [Oleiphilus sp. HI0072]KZZ13186.1 ApbE family protein [Oleiphilus sp. HI0078]KZZ21959.1 ApbE family protein [Oleiphilus sp. HI0081]KZY28110.1 ApbE family protein [Oleiphilus sp. HI0043]KZY29474.1 ApbE family protein [Oleiphilus sp. HI0043]